MDLDNIIPVVVLIFWGLAALLGKGAKNKRRGKQEQASKSGLLGQIKSAVENFAEEVQSSSSSNFNFKLLEDDISQDEEIVVAKTKKPVRPVKETEAFFVPEAKEVVDTSIHISRSKAKYSAKKLKEAIVWSEIMAPPIALRD